LGASAFAANSTGTNNTAIGVSALAATTVSDCTAIGYQAGKANTTAPAITAVGSGALASNTTGQWNTAVGQNALLSVTTGAENAAFGKAALQSNVTGANNAAFGVQALNSNTGGNNTAVGHNSMLSNTSGANNAAVGESALVANTTGVNNTTLGYTAGNSLTTQSYNTIIGARAGASTTGAQNTFIGEASGQSVTSGTRNVIIGRYDGTAAPISATGSNYIVLSDGDGNVRQTIDSNGDVIIGGTTGTASARLNVYQSDSSQRVVHFENTRNVSSDENLRLQLGSNCDNTSSYNFICSAGSADRLYIFGNGNVVNVNNSYGALSDIKLKENVVDATPKLADLMQVKVRNYNLIGSTAKQIGVVAQELEAVFPGMIDTSSDRDTEGNVIGTTTKSVKYSVFVPMLIKAIQEQQALITSLTARIAALESTQP
jgi:hypothetical protein